MENLFAADFGGDCRGDDDLVGGAGVCGAAGDVHDHDGVWSSGYAVLLIMRRLWLEILWCLIVFCGGVVLFDPAFLSRDVLVWLLLGISAFWVRRKLGLF
jgi:hypothetical protein